MPRYGMKITREWLLEHDACVSQVALFSHLYPDGLEVTLANAQAAYSAGLAVIWAFQYMPLTVALEDLDGTKKWFRDGRLHREGKPAIVGKGGYRAWYQNGLLHRTNGPAIDWGDGTKDWYVNGQRGRDMSRK